MRQGCRVTPGRGNPRESATEKSLPWCRGRARDASMVRVKRWGKSPPRTGQPGRHGKPHPEQCRIGASRGFGLPRQGPPQGRISPEARVGSQTPPVTAGPEEWSSKGASARNRIRLTGHPRNFAPVRPGAGGGPSGGDILARMKRRTVSLLRDPPGPRLPVDSARPIRKRRASRISRESTAFPMQEK